MGDVKSVYSLELVAKDSSKSLTLYPGKLAGDQEIDGKKYNLSLSGLSFTKRVYEPCHVQAEIKIALGSSTTALPSFNKTVEYFQAFESVTLKIGRIEASGPGGHTIEYKEDAGTLGTGYIIMDTRPVYRTGGGQTAMSVTLEIYSPDAYFTRRKYSQTYTGQKLGAMLDAAVTAFGLNDTLSVRHDHQTFLTFVDKSDNKTVHELIQPYLVQYNETFYELVARTANRCGEWLYYEDGKLHLGWSCKPEEIPTTTLQESDIQSATFRSRRDEMVADKNHFYSRNPVTKDPAAPGAWSYNMEMSADEYLAPLTKNEFDSASGWRSTQTNLMSLFVAKMLDCDTLYKGIIDFVFDVVKSEATWAQRAKMGNDKDNKAFFKGDAAKEQEHFNDKPEDATTTTPFSTNPDYKNRADGYTADINFDLYKKVREVQLGLDAKSLDVDLGGKLQALSVGNIIKIANLSDGLYMVTEVSGSDATVGDSRAEKMEIRAVPIDSGKKALFPPARKEDYVPRGGQQAAYITSNSDPLRQGRVRIRFAWETSGSAGSPWIRMTMPFASKNEAGVFFTPQNGDEVLVDFAGGNMERPVVIGSLYNKDNQPPYTQHLYHSVYRSPGGHAIKTADATDIMGFVGNIIPAIGLIRSFVPYVKSDVDSDSASAKLLGFTELSDEYGIYNLTLDSAKRQIAISSPFGDVKINAYTGITINAPNGDVKIVGKNVEIVANNNLKLVAGQNIKNKSINMAIRKKDKAGLDAEIAKAIFYDNLAKKALDLPLLRTVIDTFLKPIEGTLTVKSHRFMKLEAGNGDAHIPSTAYARPSVGVFGKREIALRKLGRSIEYVSAYVDTVLTHYKKAYNEIVAGKTALDQTLINLNAQIGNDVKAAAVIQRGLGDNPRDFTMDELTNAIPAEQRAAAPEADRTTALQAINELLAKVGKFRPKTQHKPSTLCPENKKDIYLDKIDEVYEAIDSPDNYRFISNRNDLDFALALPEADAEGDTQFKKRLVRLLSVKLISAYKAEAKLRFVFSDEDNGVQDSVENAVANGDIPDDVEWGKYIRALSSEENPEDEGKQSSTSTLVQLLGKIPFIKAEERNFYRADNSMGRILISDNGDGRTLQIEHGAFIQYDNKGYEQVLKQIKAACGVEEVEPAVPQPDNEAHNEENDVDGGDE